MSIANETAAPSETAETQFVTFRVGDVLMGIDIRQVEEINRQFEVTTVSQAPKYVRGVFNLRGEVTTLVDLRTILRLPTVEITRHFRTVVVRSNNERVGLLVDRIDDVVEIRIDEIDPLPANLGGFNESLFKGVFKLKTELLVVLDVEAVLTVEPQHS